MKLHNPLAEVYVPDGLSAGEGWKRVTHLGIGAHHDDLEFMAFHGIVSCFHHEEGTWFGGVTCTDGAGSSRSGRYQGCSDDEMRATRKGEQRAAAMVGRYAAMAQLAYPSGELLAQREALADDLEAILRASRPRIVYTHNLADKHDSHIGVAAAALEAIRRLDPADRPGQFLGCEGWRDLDWLCDGEKVALDVSGHDHLAAALNGIFDSQIAGGKRYDLAITGRRAANATMLNSHATDAATQVSFAMDLTPLVLDDSLDPVAFTLGAVDRFRGDVSARLQKFLVRQA